MAWLKEKTHNADPYVKETEQLLEWFCGKINEPYPQNNEDKDKIFARMLSTGWLRQSEIDTYKLLTKDPDDDDV